MPKMKSKKSVVKRIKVTARGKLMRMHPGSGHLKSRKSPKRLRNMRKNVPLTGGFKKQAQRLLGR